MSETALICSMPKCEKMIKGWKYSTKLSDFKELKASNKNNGYVYAARIQIIQGFTLLKIGATRDPYTRLSAMRKRADLFAVSPEHENFFDNEEKCHIAFEAQRVPPRPHQGSQAELFNLSLSYFLKNIPNLEYRKN